VVQSNATTPQEYFQSLSPERREPMQKIWQQVKSHIPSGFQEGMSYGMLGYVVPHRLYPAGYHCDPLLGLPFISLASQKNYISFYHMGLYIEGDLHKWFLNEWSKHTNIKLDMGKSCIRFKKIENIPYELLGALSSKITVKEWIAYYEANIKSASKNNSDIKNSQQKMNASKTTKATKATKTIKGPQ
jgi:hypothetical protein